MKRIAICLAATAAGLLSAGPLTAGHLPPVDQRLEAVQLAMEHDAAGWERMRGARRVTCAGCGYVALADRTKHRVGARPADEHFDLPLWLQARCVGEVLWAYNEAHLAWLEQFVAARHRERQEPYSGNKTMASRLPRWMKSRENRSAVLSKLSELRARLSG